MSLPPVAPINYNGENKASGLPRNRPSYIRKDQITWVYRAYNKAGDLLYIGITNNPKTRIVDHRSNSVWWDDKSDMTWESFDTRGEAEYAESLAIKTENPVFNIQAR